MDEIDITELNVFFRDVDPPHEVKLYTGITITDVPKFINSHLDILCSGNTRMVDIYLPRLLRLKELLSTALRSDV